MRIRPLLKRVAGAVLDGVAFVFAPVLRVMALYGFGTGRFLRRGVLPLPVHYYSPVPDVDDLVARDVWSRRSALPGIDFNVEGQLELLRRLGAAFGEECRWPFAPTANVGEFHLDNTNFSYGCAAALYSMLRDLAPARVVEIGSGNSSKVIAAALARNARTGGPKAAFEVVNPYPDESVLAQMAWPCTVHRQRVEAMPIDLLTSLGDRDVLFIDSGHTVRIGGDVNFLFLDVIPRLVPGVVVHVHDVNLPYEYNRAYATHQPGTFLRLWTEAYLLQAFLAHNAAWEVLLGMRFLQLDHPDEFRRAFPHFDPARHTNMSSSFWMRRRPVVG